MKKILNMFFIFIVIFFGTRVYAKEDVCKRVKDSSKLHQVECNVNNNNDFCSGAGYRTNGTKGTTTITYGQIGRGENVNPGDAYNCDVNGDGVYDDDTERFYFVSMMDKNNAVLIHSGVGASTKYSSSEGTGPSLAKNKLPSSDDWSNISLSNTSRIIKNGELGTTISLGTREITNPFSYAGYTSRLLSLEDIKNMDSNLYNTYANPIRGDLDNYVFLLENTRFETGNNSKYQGYWLENLKDSNPELTYGQVPVYYINGQQRVIQSKQWSATDFGVKTVIEVNLSEVGVYTITYNLDGGTATNPIKYTEDSDSFTLNEPELYGYNFIGWTGSNGDIPQKQVTIESGTTGNLEFTANYEMIKYHVQIYDGDNIIYDDMIPLDNEVSKPADPVHDGYEFLGWYVDDNEYDFITEVKSDLIIRAKYKLNTYSISYDLDGGEATNPDSYTYESDDIVLQEPTKVNYLFEGWTGSNGETPQKNVIIPKNSVGDKNYKANYSKIKFDVTIQDGDNTLFNDKVEIDSTVTKPSDPVRDGYTFLGWYVDDNEYDFNTPVTSNLLIKSKYELDSYTIYLNPNGGVLNGDSNIDYTYETPSFELEQPTRDGYEFVGWSDGTTVSKNVTINKGSIGDKKYNAVYKANDNTKYTVNHYKMDLNGEYTILDTEYLYGTTDTEVTPNIKEYTGFTSPSTKTITISADGSSYVDYKYERNKYDVNIDEDSNALIIGKSGKYFYGEEIKISIEPENGYNFIKWSNGSTDKEITLNVTKDITLTPVIKPIEYIFVEGMGESVLQGNDIKFKTNGEYSLVEKLYIDDKIVDSNYYELSSGSTIIKLKGSYTKKLKTGTHKIAVSYKNTSKPETTFKVINNGEKNPNTLDNIGKYILLGIGSLLGIGILIIIFIKIKKSK